MKSTALRRPNPISIDAVDRTRIGSGAPRVQRRSHRSMPCSIRSSRQIQSLCGGPPNPPPSCGAYAHSQHSSDSVSTAAYPRWESSAAVADLPAPDIPVIRMRVLPSVREAARTANGWARRRDRNGWPRARGTSGAPSHAQISYGHGAQGRHVERYSWLRVDQLRPRSVRRTRRSS